MILGIVGSRSFRDRGAMVREFEKFGGQVTGIVTGGARGADHLAEDIASMFGIPCRVIRPKYGGPRNRYAPLLRNAEIVQLVDGLLASWDGESRGTAHVISLARRARKPCRIIRFSPAQNSRLGTRPRQE